ncbi:hypothetical protein VM1G_11831 [Cytospora mali]|uniref:Uncharacterized protein n=1 Tax=Cytospora mali TaxID=578113 RepID=A0A194W7J8_CYTMA|nr:hypothetical protein VM1G_11831 [Valsa mali]
MDVPFGGSYKVQYAPVAYSFMCFSPALTIAYSKVANPNMNMTETAHLLKEAVSQNPPASPSDRHTIKHYNLDKTTGTNRLLVLGFYKMIFEDIGVFPAELDKWRQQGSMAENLERVLDESKSRVVTGCKKKLMDEKLGYYLFFQYNRELFSGILEEPKSTCVII